MATEYECAIMSQQVYYDGKKIKDKNNKIPPAGGTPPPGWIVIDTSYAGDGFAYAAYEKQTTHEIIIAFRGTINIQKFKKAINNLACGRLPNIVKRAEAAVIAIMKKNPTKRIYLTGHLLGSVLAQFCVYRLAYLNLSCTLFDPPGLPPDKIKKPNDFNDETRVICFFSLPNIANKLYKKDGKLMLVHFDHLEKTNIRMWHAFSCIWGTTARVACWSGLGISAGLLIYSLGEKLLSKIFIKSIEHENINAVLKPNNIGTIASICSLFFKAKYFAYTSKTALAGVIALGLVPQLKDDFDWAYSSYSMDNFVAAFDKNGPKHKSNIKAWPWNNRIQTRWYFETKEFYFFHKANRGLHTMPHEYQVMKHQMLATPGLKIEDEKIPDEALGDNINSNSM